MKLIIGLLTLIMLISCERHQSTSSVEENELLRRDSLKVQENMLKAFIERDYETLQNYFSQSIDVDLLISDGKNLLVMAIDAVDFKMVEFLLQNEANPNLSIDGEEETYTPIEHAENIDDDEERESMLKVLNNEIETVNDFIYYRAIQKVGNGSTLDLNWLGRLLGMGLDHEAISEKEFGKIYMKKGGGASNSLELFALVIGDADAVTNEKWKGWVEKPFVSGRYRQGKCSFYQEDNYETFETFLESCSPKARKKLERARSKILPYLQFRNTILK